MTGTGHGDGTGVVADGTSPAAVEHFRRTGWVHVRPPGAAALARDLRRWADEVAGWGDGGDWDGAVSLRRWDDAGKVDGLAVPPLDELVPLLHDLAR